MYQQPSTVRLSEKSSLHRIQVELQQGYNLSPVEALVLSRRVQELVDEQAGSSRQPGQITYQAIAINEPAGKPLGKCRKVPVHLTVFADRDAEIWAAQGAQALRVAKIHRIVYEATLQGGALSQEDIACLLGISLRTVKRVFAAVRAEGVPLPSRGELQDIGPGVSHKIPLIRRYVRDMAFSEISRELGGHGLDSLVRYLRHFSLVMILQDRELTPDQMQSIIGISPNLIGEYQQLYAELQEPQFERVLHRLKRAVYHAPIHTQKDAQLESTVTDSKKGAL